MWPRAARSSLRSPCPIPAIVEVIISGGMGGGAVEIFNERNVEVVLGAQGDARDAVERYLKGELESTGSICHEHEHADECHG